MKLQIAVSDTAEVFLNPGDCHFHSPVPGRAQPAGWRTLLGSCISVILWHPERRLAGMSHVVLPRRCGGNEAGALDGRFCDEAITLLLQDIARSVAHPRQFQVYLVGGGRMYHAQSRKFSIGNRNIEAARDQLKQAGFTIRAEHVGKDYYRKVELDLRSGEVTVAFANKRVNLSPDNSHPA